MSLSRSVPDKMVEDSSFQELARTARLRLLQMHFESNAGHIGGNLSALDLMLFLHHRVMTSHDHFVLSKGHAAGALYITLWTLGLLKDSDLRQFHKDATLLSGHPPQKGIPQITFATGSLGHGLGLAAGLALGKRLQGLPGKTWCLVSDGEWNEGSSWESLIFIAHQRLQDLTIIVDANGLQGFGTTAEVADLSPLAEKFCSFGLQTLEIDGHDCSSMHAALTRNNSGPRVIIARTIKGYGVSFMENRMDWHYRPISEAQYRQGVRELMQACETCSAETL